MYTGKIFSVGEAFPLQHLVHHVDVCFYIERLVLKQGIQTFFIGGDCNVEHFIDVGNALVDVFSFNSLGRHSVIGVEEFDRRREIITEEFFDLRDIRWVFNGIFRDFFRDLHDLIDLILYFRISDRGF